MTLLLNDTDWHSIRHTWPIRPGNYEVYDCRYKKYGEAYYDGYDFSKIAIPQPARGPMIHIDYIVTHWRQQK